MGLRDIIRSLFKKEEKILRIQSTDLAMDSIFIPKYANLSEEDKKKVDSYIEEVDFEKLDTLMMYADDMSDNAYANTYLLLNLFRRITTRPLEAELNRLSDEEIVERRLDALIQKEELIVYKQELIKLKEESTLRAVALEEIKRREGKRRFDFIGLFGSARKLERKNKIELLENATERMRISKKTIEQQMEVVINGITTEEISSTTYDIYKSQQKLRSEKSDDTKGKELNQEILRQRVNKAIQMVRLVMPNEEEALKNLENKKEKEIVKTLANVQRKLDVYAYTHGQEALEQLRQEVAELSLVEKTLDNREELLNKINDIQTKYRIFSKFVKPEDLQNLFKIKFDILIQGINKQDELPFEGIEDKEEMAYYGRILEAKLEEILQGKNPHFANEFGENQSEAIQIIRKIINKEIGEYLGEKILVNKRVSGFILAFERENGMSDFIKRLYFEEKDLINRRKNEIFEFQDNLPLEIIYQLDRIIDDKEGRLAPSKPWVELLEQSKYNDERRNFERETIIPEGIIELKSIKQHGRYRNSTTYKRLTELRRLILPNSLQRIGRSVFELCQKLEEVVFNEILQNIGDEAFKNCCNLKGVVFNEGLQSIGTRAFLNCQKLEEVVFNEILQNIGDEAFKNCCNLKGVVFNEGLQRIGPGAFSNCANLKKVVFNKELQSIGDWAFEDCFRLKKVVFNKGLQSIGMFAFSGCEELEEVVFNEKLQSIGMHAFSNCANLKKVVFNERLQSIGAHAFFRCEKLEEVVFNEKLQSIGPNAFSNCANLKKVVFNKELQSIGDWAFEDCFRLEEVVFNKGLQSIGEQAFKNCKKLTKVIFYEGLQSIEYGAFKGCESLKKIVLPISLNEIGEYAFGEYGFERCDSLKEVVIMDGKKEVIHLEISNNDDIYNLPRKIIQLIQEYKRRHPQKEEFSR